MQIDDPAPPEQKPHTANGRRAKVRVLPALVGVGFLWQAVDFGLSGSWPFALLCLFLFCAVEALAFAAAPSRRSSRRGG
jgi:hypothetical protein